MRMVQPGRAADVAGLSTRRAIARAAPDRTAPVQTAIATLLTLNTIVSASNFNPALTGLGESNNVQQYLTLLAWGAIIGLSFLARPSQRLLPWLDVGAACLFYGFAVVSVVWSELAVESALKALALAVTTFGAYRLAISLPAEQIAESAFRGLFVVAAASIAVVIVNPTLGINHEWMHAGLWQGVFESKQSLGLAGAFLMYFAACRLLSRPGWLVSGTGFALGAISVVGSGSRGGGAMALLSILCVLASGRNLGVSRVMALVPILVTVVAGLVLLHLGRTGQPYIDILGIRTDLTERVLIWQYALQHFGEHPYLGFGLNGFWSDPELYYRYKRVHGWVLDNFHNGFLTVLMETGLAGFSLLGLTFLLFGLRMFAIGGSARAVPLRFNLCVGYACLFFIYNLTETFLNRSTNIVAALMVAFLFASATAGPPPARLGRPA